MRILGLDPGSQHTGWGVVERHGSRLVAIDQGRLSPPRGMPLPARLGFLAHGLGDVLGRFRPEVAVLEALFRGVNDRSLIVLAQARGALLVTLAGGGVEIHEYAPAEIKSAVVGNGRADKGQVARMVALALGLGATPHPTDVTDALAAALCHAQRQRFDRLAAAAPRPPRRPPSR